MKKDFFTITELSETLGLDESGIRKKCRLGKIKAEKIEDQWQISNQAQQLSAMQQKTIDKLTEQNQLLLETTQQKKPSFWQRLIGQKI